MGTFKKYAGLAVALVALGVGGFFAASASAAGQTGLQLQAQAQRANPHPVRFYGEVKALGANSVTLSTPRGDITANVSPNTWIVVQKADGPGQGALSDLKVNEHAAVAGMTTNDPKMVDARVITQGVREGKEGRRDNRRPNPRNAGQGTIKSINGNTLTVTNNRGIDVRVEATADTLVLDSGFKAVSTLKAGDNVQVFGVPRRVNRDARATRDNLKINAWGIRVVRDGVDLVAGRVESVNGNAVTLNRSENLTVNLGTATQYRKVTISTTDRKATLLNATQADVKGDSHIIVEGTKGTDGKTLNATSVIIVPGKADIAPQV